MAEGRYKAVMGDWHADLPATAKALEETDGISPQDRYSGGDMVEYGKSPGEVVDLLRANIPEKNMIAGNHEYEFGGSLPLLVSSVGISGRAYESGVEHMEQWVGLPPETENREANLPMLARVFRNPFTGVDPLEQLEKKKQEMDLKIAVTIKPGEGIKGEDGGLMSTRRISELFKTPGARESLRKVTTIEDTINRIKEIRAKWVDPQGNSYWDFFMGLFPRRSLCFNVAYKGQLLPVNVYHGNPFYTDPTDYRSLIYVVSAEGQRAMVKKHIENKVREKGAPLSVQERVTEETRIMQMSRRAEDLINYEWVPEGVHIFFHSHIPFDCRGKNRIILGGGSVSEPRFGYSASYVRIDQEAQSLEKMFQVTEIK